MLKWFFSLFRKVPKIRASRSWEKGFDAKTLEFFASNRSKMLREGWIEEDSLLVAPVHVHWYETVDGIVAGVPIQSHIVALSEEKIRHGYQLVSSHGGSPFYMLTNEQMMKNLVSPPRVAPST